MQCFLRAHAALFMSQLEKPDGWLPLLLRKATLLRQPKRESTKRLGALPADLRKSIAYDNGSENSEHEAINQILGTTSFLRTPFHSWEKGSVENTIGIIRRTLPKGTNRQIVSSRRMHLLEKNLNDRPRKCLKLRTPMKVLMSQPVALPC